MRTGVVKVKAPAWPQVAQAAGVPPLWEVKAVKVPPQWEVKRMRAIEELVQMLGRRQQRCEAARLVVNRWPPRPPAAGSVVESPLQ